MDPSQTQNFERFGRNDFTEKRPGLFWFLFFLSVGSLRGLKRRSDGGQDRRTRPALSRMDKGSVPSLILKVSWKPHRHKQGCSEAAGDYRLRIVRKWQEVLLS